MCGLLKSALWVGRPVCRCSTQQRRKCFGSVCLLVDEPEVGARTEVGLGAGAIAGIVIAVILIVLITIDLFCCFFNSCGVIFCCHQALCGGGGSRKDNCKYGDKVDTLSAVAR